MRHPRVLLAIITIAFTIGRARSEASVIVYSNSFEPADGYPSPGGSFTTGGTGMAGNVALYDNANYFGQATSGSQYLVFNRDPGGGSGGSFTSPNLTTLPGGVYTLSLQYGMWNGAGPQSLQVTATDTITSALLLNQTITDSTGSTTAFAVMSLITLPSFTAAGNPISLKFLDTTANPAVNDGLFDNIQLSGPIIPEPSTVLLLFVGGTLLIRRRAAIGR